MDKIVKYGFLVTLGVTLAACRNNSETNYSQTSDGSNTVSSTSESSISNEYKSESIVASDDKLVAQDSITISDPLKINFNKADLVHVENASDFVKTAANTDQKEFYYIDIEYNIINDTVDMYTWSHFNEIAVNNIKSDIKSFGHIQSYSIEPNITVGPNSIKMIVPKDTQEVQLFPTEAFLDNTFTGEEPDFKSEPIIVRFFQD